MKSVALNEIHIENYVFTITIHSVIEQRNDKCCTLIQYCEIDELLTNGCVSYTTNSDIKSYFHQYIYNFNVS